MMLQIFTIMMLIALVLIGLGYYMDADILRIFGFFMIFMLGITLINSSGLDYKIGDTVETVGDTTTVTHNYAKYNSLTMNIFLSIIGVMGITLVLAERATKNGQGG